MSHTLEAVTVSRSCNSFPTAPSRANQAVTTRHVKREEDFGHAMSDPRFKPRAYTLEPLGFGKVQTIQWMEPESDTEADRILASKLQHEYAVRINRRLKEIGKSVRDYATMTGIGYDRIARVLRGEAVMRLEDVAQAERLLHGITTLQPATEVEPANPL